MQKVSFIDGEKAIEMVTDLKARIEKYGDERRKSDLAAKLEGFNPADGLILLEHDGDGIAFAPALSAGIAEIRLDANSKFNYHTTRCGDNYHHVWLLKAKPTGDVDNEGDAIYQGAAAEPFYFKVWSTAGAPEYFGCMGIKYPFMG